MSNPTLGKGEAIAISDADIARLADALHCHPADLEAIATVESGGFGWFNDGRIKILFEKHWFYKYLEGTTRTNAVKSGLARASWVSPSKGGYKDQATPDQRYSLLERALKVNREGAFRSVSLGTFQIMGFNHKVCGHPTAEDMFNKFCQSEVYQLSAFAAFLKSKGLVSAMQRRDFDEIERGYNGGGLNGAYAAKMRAASNKLRAGKWANYKPGSYTVPKPANPPPVPIDAPPAPEPEGGWLAALLSVIAKAFNRSAT
jgi:hypothetical protein